MFEKTRVVATRLALHTALVYISVALAAETGPGRTFVLEEATIERVHAGFQTGTLTCRGLVTGYLARIERFDRQGPALHAITSVNPQAKAEADRLDREYARRGLTGPLHCVPVIVKDNIATAGWETTAGSAAFKGYIPEHDADAVARLKAAGAIMLAKGNMPDLALNVLQTVNLLYGSTRNPYGLDRVPAGSSGGTAAAIAANFGLVGLATDTGGSIRGPAAHTSVVGVRPTFGLNSLAGVVPLDVLSDTVGPITRTVEDAALVLDVLAGSESGHPASAPRLQDGLAGVRVGILSQAYMGGPRTTDPEVGRLFAQALNDLVSLGVMVIPRVELAPLPNLPEMDACRGLKYNIDEFLAALGPRAPIASFDDIISTGRYHPSLKQDLLAMQAGRFEGPDSKACRAAAAYQAGVAAALTAAMDAQRLNALVYPTWSQRPQQVSNVDLRTAGPALRYASAAGFPAVTVPMGFTTDVLPSGLSLLGRRWADADLLRIAYAFEQATGHRRPSVLAPPMPCHCTDVR
jgi:Asp-tRNA(Asn)/Glu-tRNA(Gln) amidotransferase A subunit family amidase